MSHRLVVNVKTDGCDVYVGRPSKWGNPFRFGTRAQNIADFRAWIATQPGMYDAIRIELRGKVLGCHCAPKDCHADVLAEIANS